MLFTREAYMLLLIKHLAFYQNWDFKGSCLRDVKRFGYNK